METRIRIAWKIGTTSGYGEWKEGNIKTKNALIAWVKKMNAEFGPRTHWIEEDF